MIAVTGGGTGGHLKVAKALMDELHNRGQSAVFIGSNNGADRAWFQDDKNIKEKFFLDTAGVVNQGFFGKIKSLWNIVKAVNKCNDIFIDYDVEKVISVGGYSAAPASFATLFSKAKLYIHEQNSVMGRLNSLSAKFAAKVYSSYDENSSVKDYPVAKEFFEEGRVRTGVKTIIFLGGSQGALAINDYALKMAPKLNAQNIKIIHQAGKNDFKRVKEAYEHLDIDADVFDFTTNLIGKMKQADFAVSRSGASTLWELCATGLPALFIPYPYAAGDHQFFNAKFLANDGLAYVYRQKDLHDFDLLKVIHNDENIHSMSKALVDVIMIDGVELLINDILGDE
ncbi:MAG: UDP-N-acetylglucosamine--N-acetylmuramyl-(pentapeptide) pyrophosphoryl-undecaprenol N-acetylglucosamine transferase [Campylobacterota bacterium]|nr:UDP-N-acetylglucosamine--N-acetylmuramyl-(pentapeptide) pyrophosphoryl-undecaprenol N-acetylglucosamine transferase [Campylobacterota bacterium]